MQEPASRTSGMSRGSAAALEASQTDLFPRLAITQYPKPEPTADCLGEVDADDGHRYYVKGDVEDKPVRANEWIGYRVAEHVKLVAPTSCVIKMLDGTLLFGSRKIYGVSGTVETQNYLRQASILGDGSASELGRILSQIYALDMMLFNVDRHYGNFLSVQDGSFRRLLVYDFGRSIWWKWPWNGFPASNENTRIFGKMSQALHGFDPDSFCEALDRIVQVSAYHGPAIIRSVPEEWLTVSQREELHAIVSGSHMKQRRDELVKGVIDGSLL